MVKAAEYLSPVELVARWQGAVKVGTLANWRNLGKGPGFAKFGSRVRYPLKKVIEWEEKNLHGANDNEAENTRIEN